MVRRRDWPAGRRPCDGADAIPTRSPRIARRCWWHSTRTRRRSATGSSGRTTRRRRPRRAPRWPLRQVPGAGRRGRTVVEASIIIEHLGLHHPGPVRLIPEDASAALAVPYAGPVLRQLCDDADAEDRGRRHAGLRRPGRRAGVTEARARWTPPIAGWTARSWAGNGRRAPVRASPIVRRPRRCSMPTGRTPSGRRSHGCGPTARGCWRGHPLPGRWTRGASTGVLPAGRAGPD